MRSLEIETDGNNLEVPPMNSGIPQYEAVGGLAENHPGEPKGSDTVPAWLTPGEFVVNKEATDLFGPQIKQMNDIGREIQDGNMSPDQAPPVYASEGKLLKEFRRTGRQYKAQGQGGSAGNRRPGIMRGPDIEDRDDEEYTSKGDPNIDKGDFYDYSPYGFTIR